MTPDKAGGGRTKGGDSFGQPGKGYGRVSSVGSATSAGGELASALSSSMAGISGSQTGEAVVWPRPAPEPILIFPIYNGDSHKLHDFFTPRIRLLGQASGTHAFFIDFGNPLESEEIWEKIREPFFGSQDMQAGREYVEQVLNLGLDLQERLRLMDGFADHFGIDVAELPVLVVKLPTLNADLIKLSIQPDWYLTERGTAAFSSQLQETVRSEELKKIVAAGTAFGGAGKVQRLLRRMGERIDQDLGRASVDRDTPRFERQGDTWLLVFNGVGKTVRDSVGMTYIAYLLENPHQTVDAQQLRVLVGGGKAAELGSAGKVLDEDAIKNYRERLRQNLEERAQAQEDGDLAKLKVLNDESEAIDEQLEQGIGLSGRRREAGDISEQARKAVSEAINRALRAIKRYNPSLHNHLRQSISKGKVLEYRPEKRIDWDISHES